VPIKKLPVRRGPDIQKLETCKRTITEAIEFLKSSGKSPKILVKIARNLGDSLHGQPIMRHYRQTHPDAAIAFMTEKRYVSAHEYDSNIDKIFALPDGLDGQTRLALWDLIKKNPVVDIAIVPAINPFQAIHKENAWCHDNIVTQYLYNAGIKGEPLGGRVVEVKVDDQDRAFIDKFGLPTNRLVGLEYISYSSPPCWNIGKFADFAKLVGKLGYRCVSIAGSKEPLIPGTIDFRGTTWRQATALLSRCKFMIGSGSGMTMLAAAARPQPTIIELNVPANVTIAGCGYAPAQQVNAPTPASVVEILACRS
jgi:ADP-heptose:LPS heptosyltransferase